MGEEIHRNQGVRTFARFFRSVTPAPIIFLCLALAAPASAEVDAPLVAPSTEESRTALTVEAVKNRADDIAASSGLDEATQTLLTELYRQSIGSLEAVKTYREAAERFETAIQSSKEDTARLRAELEQRRTRGGFGSPGGGGPVSRGCRAATPGGKGRTRDASMRSSRR